MIDPISPPPVAADPPWWWDAVVYQIYPRSFADGDGDGMGDLPGIIARLRHVGDLGADAIWLSPFYPSPMADAGYDVADYRDVDPLFGTLADADRLVAEARELGLKVLLDLVPNHSSDEHPWFQAALAAGPYTPQRERYHFRDGLGSEGQLPPNNWRSVFGGPAWSRVLEPDGTRGQWYLHLFDAKQPDWNWLDPIVREEFRDILRFWFDRGVAGFRIDVAHGLVKADGLPDWDPEEAVPEHRSGPMWDQAGVHEIYREWRRVFDSYDDPERVACAEVWVSSPDRVGEYLGPDRLHQAFAFGLLESPWEAEALRDAITENLSASAAAGAPTTWVLSNHDVVRHPSRLGLRQDRPRPNGIGIGDPQPDEKLGLRRARAATALMLALPGAAYLYQGEELGLPEMTDLPDELRQDPTFVRSQGTERGRDGCRVPLPWTTDGPSLGFGSGPGWLPQPAGFARYAASVQEGVAGSTLELYKEMLALRRQLRLGTGALSWEPELCGPETVAAVITLPSGERILVVTHLGADRVQLPAGVRVVLSSSPLDEPASVPTDTTVWARW